MKFKKKLSLLFSFFSILLFTACNDTENFEEIESITLTENIQSKVDTNTPQTTQPFILSNSKSTQSKTLAPPSSQNWILDFSDEFDGTTINNNKWVTSISTKSRAPRANLGVNDWWWVNDNAFLNGNGQLVLRGTKVDNNTMHCGAIESRNIYEPQYGYLEARIDIAETAKGNHTAFWLQGHNQGNVDGTANDGAEVDIFESAWTGDYTKSVVHIDGYGANHQASTQRYDTPGIHSGYHVYGLNWNENTMEIYYDGVHMVTYTGDWVPQVAEWLWLSVGASFGDGDFQSQPNGILSDALVDYVRVWKLDETSPPPPPTNNTTFRIVNKSTGKWLKTSGSTDNSIIQQAPSNQFGGWTQWEQEEIDSNTFYFVNAETRKYFRPSAKKGGSNLLLKTNTDDYCKWQKIDAGNGYFYLKNTKTGKYIRPNTSDDGSKIVIKRLRSNDWFKWKFEYIQ